MRPDEISPATRRRRIDLLYLNLSDEAIESETTAPARTDLGASASDPIDWQLLAKLSAVLRRFGLRRLFVPAKSLLKTLRDFQELLSQSEGFQAD